MICLQKYKLTINCFLKKNSGFENLAAAKSTVDDVTITSPIIIKLVTHAKKRESSPLLSKKSMIFLILSMNIIIYKGFKVIASVFKVFV